MRKALASGTPAATLRPMTVVWLLLAVLALQALPARADTERQMADLELVLAVDVSRSMDFGELVLQRRGYAEAFRSREVIEAITGGGFGRIVVTFVEWAGYGTAHTVIEWTLIDDAQSAHAFANRLQALSPERLRRTSISGALKASAELFETAPYRGLRRVVDVSGDGPNNHGVRVDVVRDRLVENGIVINGLPLMIRNSTFGFGIENLDEYYVDCVIGGTGSFVIPVYDWQEFPRAVRRKLVLEIAGTVPRPLVQQASETSTGRDPVDCLIGEKIWRERMRELDWQ